MRRKSGSGDRVKVEVHPLPDPRGVPYDSTQVKPRVKNNSCEYPVHRANFSVFAYLCPNKINPLLANNQQFTYFCQPQLQQKNSYVLRNYRNPRQKV